MKTKSYCLTILLKIKETELLENLYYYEKNSSFKTNEKKTIFEKLFLFIKIKCSIKLIRTIRRYFISCIKIFKFNRLSNAIV